LIVVGLASAEKPVIVRTGNLELVFNGGFTPKTLSRTKPTPIKVSLSGEIITLDGSHPPALKEFLLETDKHGEINVTGYPTCKKSQLQATNTEQAEKVCGPAIVGTGTTVIGIEFEESSEIDAHSKLLVINGGVKGGVTTLFVHAYITKPVASAVVTTVKIKKIHKGPFGTLSIATIPKIAGGAGSVKSFSLSVFKKFTFHHKKVSILTAKCTNGKFQARGTAVFVGLAPISAEVTRTCTPKG
jgi:hypothetical protein